MPSGRRAYKSDLDLVISSLPSGVANVTPGEDDGFSWIFHREGQANVKIDMFINDSGQYPHHHTFFVCAADDAPPHITAAIASMSSVASRTVFDTIMVLSRCLNFETPTGCVSNPIETEDDNTLSAAHLSDCGEDQVEQDSADEDGDIYDVWAEDTMDVLPQLPLVSTTSQRSQVNTSMASFAREDLKICKNAGFKIGHLGHLREDCSCFISVAIRVSKLCLSVEAMHAWAVRPSNYLILLLYYPHGYKTHDFLTSFSPASKARHYVSMAVRISDHYRPLTVSEAQLSMQSKHKDDVHRGCSSSTGNAGLRETFISDSIDALLNERLFQLIRFRADGMSWGAAEQYYNNTQGLRDHDESPGMAKYRVSDQFSITLPAVVKNDHLRSNGLEKRFCFPLLATEFMLKHFVRCTEFCMVCYDKMPNDIGAIKPYVCDKPLCLYQYMNLGMGPNIEHEIVSQPWVIDLLISFCYSAARGDDFSRVPQGLSLRVPADTVILAAEAHLEPPYQLANQPSVTEDMMAEFFTHFNELQFDSAVLPVCPLKVGDWVCIQDSATIGQAYTHHRVVEVYYPKVKLSPPVNIKKASTQPGTECNSIEPRRPESSTTVAIFPYNYDFDTLENHIQARAICLLLDLLPNVMELREYLLKGGHSLMRWSDRISPAALGVLRWIVASNRAHIVQVDQPEVMAGTRPEDRVQGVQGWLQFRIAMGSPEKEQRFISAIKAETSTLPFPTIFAWHGSALTNWFGILHDGLNIDKVSHGRAHGNGVYHAKDFNTSYGYCHQRQGITKPWTQSQLRIVAAVALNEIINAPDYFTSSNPFYVVPQLDWIQTRYLFVSPDQVIATEPEKVPSKTLQQDPRRIPSGPHNSAIVLPVTAISKSRQPHSQPPSKKQRLTAEALEALSDGYYPGTDEVTASVSTLEDDLAFLMEDDPPACTKDLKEAVSPFVVATVLNLKMLPPPIYATSSATHRITKDLQALMRTQDKHKSSPQGLGWYFHSEYFEVTNNLYQWIVELHSFPLKLPLAVDMIARGIQSIVLELCFHPDYPNSPPFVRVVRPRLMQFKDGGGGHVTAGGSICMDLLTNSGWSAANDIESVLLQIRMALMSSEPNYARLARISGNLNAMTDYSVGEAIDAYQRVARSHDWVIPNGMSQLLRWTESS